MNLRKEAKGRQCQIRVPGVCNCNPETVVLCHIHKPSISGGTGLKADDMLAAWGCSACHDAVDGRTRLFDNEQADYQTRLSMLMEGVLRTQKILLDEGKIGVIK